MNKLIILSLAVFCLASVQGAPTIPKSLQGVTHPVDILISMNEGSPSLALDSLKTLTFKSRDERLNAVASTLKAVANTAQKDLLNFLQDKAGNSVRQLWISNQIIVRNASPSLIQELSTRSDISKIETDRRISVEDLFGRINDGPRAPHKPTSIKAGEQWGVVTVEAPLVWANGTRGQGIVVGTIDTGVRRTHEALRDSYRGGEYSWFAPFVNSQNPDDVQGHGTHTMGTILGVTNGIGVAPDATWMSCQMCYEDLPECSSFSLVECGQWIACPTKYDGSDPDCSQAPHVVSNSWGWEVEFDDVLAAWTAGGIIPIFAMGNEGPGCSSYRYPGSETSVIGVGATDDTNTITYFSSVGPNSNGDIRPDVAAPGDYVLSSSAYGDTEYEEMSGTSMACPHVAGVATLLLSRNPNLTFEEIRDLLRGGAVPVNPTQSTCGGISDTVYPNNHVGHGLVDAWNSYKTLIGAQ